MDDYNIRMMKEDFKVVKNFFQVNGERMQIVEERIDVLLAKNIEVLKYLVEDIVFFYDTLQLYHFTCHQLVGSNNSFFNITTFNRAILESTFVILEKLKDLLKEIPNDRIIADKIRIISKDVSNKKGFRNRLEHALDPHYGGDNFKINEEFPLDEQLLFLERVVEIIEILSCRNIMLNNVLFKLEYEPLCSKKIREEVTSMNEFIRNIFLHLCEISYRFENVYKDIGIEERIIADLCIKLLETNKSIRYMIVADGIEPSLKGKVEAYFSRIAIIKCYQMCDKFAKYISLDSNQKTYFKSECKKLEEKKCQLNDVEIKMLNLCKSADYKVLSQIRNFIEHKKGFVNYEDNSAIISSVIVNVYKELYFILQLIVTQYFRRNGIKISERAYRECDEKSMIYRI